MMLHAAIALVMLAAACSAPQARSSGPTATTDTIDLDLENVPTTDALGALAANAKINIFADSDIDDAGPVTASVHGAPWREVLDKIAADHHLRVEKLDVRGGERPAFWITKQTNPPAPVTAFTGDRITARFDDTPIREVAKSLSVAAGTTIAVDDGVDAPITLHLRLPWDLALYHLAQKYNLRIVRDERGIRISRR